jgi:hypothetical protein
MKSIMALVLAVMMGGTNHGASGRIGADGSGTAGWSDGDQGRLAGWAGMMA